MRWQSKNPIKPGDERVITTFLLLPECVGNQWRWLEVAARRQAYVCGRAHCRWVSVEWVTP